MPAWSEANDGVEFSGVRASVDGMAQERAMLIARTETTPLQDAVNKTASEKMAGSPEGSPPPPIRNP